MSSGTDGLKRKRDPDASSASKHEIPPEKIRCCPSNILDIPSEILIKIILFLNARERLGLGNSCKRFNSLVFEDAELLRNLDFSKNGRLTLGSDVQQYFNIENSISKILGVNLRNTVCIKPGRMLNGTIGRAKNLVDLNIHGLRFIDIWQLGSFLIPLPNLLRLSFDWSHKGTSDSHIILCSKVLERPFSRLEYMSVEMEVLDCAKLFFHPLKLCQQLEELRMVIKKSEKTSYEKNWGAPLKKLKNLKIVEYCGPCVMQTKRRFGRLLPNPEKWADFQMDSSSDPKGFYLASIDVCQELADSKWIERIPNIAPKNRLNLGWALFPELLLKEVLEITHENVPEKLCCLSTFMNNQRCLLKINEAKRLLKNPKSQISYLHINHPVDIGCDFHLVASAFTNLTELSLAAITRNLDSFPSEAHFERRLRWRGEVIPEKVDEIHMDSSFNMLVENTPRLRHFTLCRSDSRYQVWDLEELHLIPKWKYLRSLRLIDIPIEDGEFLIEIGKQCEDLQNLELIRLGQTNCCYEQELFQMLTYCRNLRDFSTESIVKEPPKVFSCLANNLHLRRVRMKSAYCSTNVAYEQQPLVSSITQLLRQCSNLTTFVAEFSCSTEWTWSEDLSSIRQRWLKELSRPSLQIKMRWGSSAVGTVREERPHFNPFPKMWIAN